MEIQAIGSVNTTLAQSQSASINASTNRPSKPAAQKAGGSPPAGKGSAKPAAASESNSSSSSTAKIYDKRDTNQDGTVSYEEELLYALKNQAEELQNQLAISSSQKQTGLNAYQQNQQTHTQSQSSASI